MNQRSLLILVSAACCVAMRLFASTSNSLGTLVLRPFTLRTLSKMAACQVADGKAVAAEVRSKVSVEINELKEKHPGFHPRLSIIQVR